MRMQMLIILIYINRYSGDRGSMLRKPDAETAAVTDSLTASIRGFAFADSISDNRAMSFGITKTVPAGAGRDFLDSLYDGRLKEYEFHMAGKEPKRLATGDYVYTIFNDELHGRLKIRRFVTGAKNPSSGRPRILVIVEAPGERLSRPIPKQGHRGTRYTDGSEWPD